MLHFLYFQPMVRPYGRHSALRLLLVTVILSVCVSVLPIGVDGVVFDNTIAQCTAVSKQQRKVGEVIMYEVTSHGVIATYYPSERANTSIGPMRRAEVSIDVKYIYN